MFTYNAKIINVVDGDTVDALVDLGFRMYSKQRLRLAHIDTPERGQVGYIEASNRLKELVLDKEVVLKTFKPSKWGHFLAEIYEGETNVVQVMLNEGHGKPYEGGHKV